MTAKELVNKMRIYQENNGYFIVGYSNPVEIGEIKQVSNYLPEIFGKCKIIGKATREMFLEQTGKLSGDHYLYYKAINE